MTLLICRTCPRYDMRATGTFGAVMSAAVAASGVAVRGVQCLGGCPEHGVVAVDGPGKTRVRFTGLDGVTRGLGGARRADGADQRGDLQAPAALNRLALGHPPAPIGWTMAV